MQKLEQKVNRGVGKNGVGNTTENSITTVQPGNIPYNINSCTQHLHQQRNQQDALVLIDSHAPVWSLDDFDIGKKLGEGQFGSVYLARERRCKFIVALKAIKKSQLLCSFNEHLLRREIDIHSHLLHPNILQFYAWFTTPTRIYLVLEVAPLGELMDKLNQGGLPEPIVAKYMKQIISAIRCCHRHNVMHRDLKPENILIDINGNLKLADFGWAAHVSTELPSDNNVNSHPDESPSFAYLRKRRKTYCGTLDYLSPEICRHEWYGTEVDVWCLGVLCYELATGGPPFSHEAYQRKGMNENDARKLQQKDIQECDIRNRLLPNMSLELKDFMVRALAKEPSQRISTAQMLKHPFIRRHCSLSDESDLSDDKEEETPSNRNGRTLRPVNRGHVLLRTEVGRDLLTTQKQSNQKLFSAVPTPRFGVLPSAVLKQGFQSASSTNNQQQSENLSPHCSNAIRQIPHTSLFR